MPEFFDTHTHLYLPEFSEDGAPDGSADAVRRAVDAGVKKMMMPNVDLTTVGPLGRLAERFPENIMTAAGLHPTEVDSAWRERLSEILAQMQGYRAVGEIGIDLYWDRTHREEQMQAFDYQLSLAEQLNLTVIIHCREALDPTLEVLRTHSGARCIMHSFTGSSEEVERVRNVCDCYFGINGIVTFKNARLESTVCEITPSRLLLETDSPYLAPTPHRGRRNESSYIPLIAARCADILQMPLSALAATTTANALSLF